MENVSNLVYVPQLSKSSCSLSPSKKPDNLLRIGKYLKVDGHGKQDPLIALTDAIADVLCSNHTLNIIQNLQRTLDPLDIEGLYKKLVTD